MSEAQALFRVSEPADLRPAWIDVRDRVEALSADQPWIPEDVFHELLMGTAHLWTTPDREGFVVLQVLASPYEKDLHVWLAHNRTDASAAEYWEQLKEIARENGCTRLVFGSARIAFKRAIPGLQVRHEFFEKL